MYKKAEKYVDNIGFEPSIEEIVEAKNKALIEILVCRDNALKSLEDRCEEIKSKLDATGKELSKTFVAEKKKHYDDVLEAKSLKKEEDDELSDDEIMDLILKSVD